jgi:hypothetical protein
VNAKWLHPIVKSVHGEALTEHPLPRNLRYWLLAWGPFVLLVERKRT